MHPYLITGVSSGLGRHLHGALGGVGLTRQNRAQVLADMQRTGVPVIVHCAFSAMREVPPDAVYRYLDDNLLLTAQILRVPHDVFVYVSSVDVYPRDERLHTEDERVTIGTRELYADMKLMNEAMVRERAAAHLILRPASLVGEHSRRNTLMRLLDEQRPTLSLSPDSEYNVVLHEEVARFVAHAVGRGLTGTFNLASSSTMRLDEAAEALGREPVYGRHRYRVGAVSNRKLVATDSAYDVGSLEKFAAYARRTRTGRDKGRARA